MLFGGSVADGGLVSGGETKVCQPTPSTDLVLGLWVTIIFGFAISGSHYNPAVTFAFMMRKDVGESA